jgi:hypothetical protein
MAPVFKVRSELPDTWSRDPQHYFCPAGGLRRGSAAARLLRLWVGISVVAWMFVCCEWGVLSGRGLWDELITRPEESYRLWCVAVCDLENSWMRWHRPTNVVTNITKKTRFRDRRNTYEHNLTNEGQTDWKKPTWQNMYKMNKHSTVIHDIFYITSNSVQSKPVPLQY